MQEVGRAVGCADIVGSVAVGCDVGKTVGDSVGGGDGANMEPELRVNISSVSTLDDISQPSTWLKLVASLNISYMSVTRLTSQDEISLLKDTASSNILFMFVTRLTSQEDKSLLKEHASRKRLCMFATRPTFHAERFALNVPAVEQ